MYVIYAHSSSQIIYLQYKLMKSVSSIFFLVHDAFMRSVKVSFFRQRFQLIKDQKKLRKPLVSWAALKAAWPAG